MARHLIPLDFQHLLIWSFKEYFNYDSVFGIPSGKFFKQKNENRIKIFGSEIGTPIGPAAGPHTQLSQNIISSYLTGGRFFELKTVQVLDSIKVDKPCIDAEDECYNVEWSQELNLEQSFDEYLKAWIIIHLLSEIFNLSLNVDKSFIFNMSVGYDLDGIRSEKMNKFINSVKDSTNNNLFNKYLEILNDKKFFYSIVKLFPKDKSATSKILFDKIESSFLHSQNISPKISNSVTLSTMHGCPPDEIERIAKYLIEEKRLHTFIKLNPTLLGFEKVKNILMGLEYFDIELDESSFRKDLNFKDAVSLIKDLKVFSKANETEFGIKLSNTLAVKNLKKILPGSDMYMSGRSLFPLTINLAKEIANELNGEIIISYSGGINALNINDVLLTGIYPVTIATDLLKPGGYFRLHEIAKNTEEVLSGLIELDGKINLTKLNEFADSSLIDKRYSKSKRETDSIKIPLQLPKFDCFVAPCTIACPAGQNVPEYIRLIEENKVKEAFDVITENNPLPNITGYICDHQCMIKCTRRDYDQSIEIRELKKIAAQKGYHLHQNKLHFQANLRKDKTSIAIIGAGPAGLSAAYFLARSGIEVTIFERSKHAGGTVYHVIPGFRLPQDAIDKDIEFVSSLGVKVIYDINNFNITDLKEKGFKYIFIGIGAPKSNNLLLSKCDREIFSSIDFLKSFNKKKNFEMGKSIAVIGGGNSAMDSARAAKRINGVENVFIIYRRTKEFMPADREEFDAAIKEDIQFKELLSPVSFENGILKCQKMILSEMDTDGRRKVIAEGNSFMEFKVDNIISAIGEHTEKEILIQNNLLSNKYDQLRVNKDSNETLIENVFIGGDALRGPSTVIESIADGKKAAETILSKEGIKIHSDIAIKNNDDIKERIKIISERKGKIYDQVTSNFQLEASRCLACNLVCNKCVEVCPNRANIALDSGMLKVQYKDAYQILHIDGLCNECGNCETFCPYNNAPYKIKPTIFWNENNFVESSNDGFYISSNNSKKSEILKIKFRLNSKIGTFLCSKDGNVFSIDPVNGNEATDNFLKFISSIIKNYSYLINEKGFYVNS